MRLDGLSQKLLVYPPTHTEYTRPEHTLRDNNLYVHRGHFILVHSTHRESTRVQHRPSYRRYLVQKIYETRGIPVIYVLSRWKGRLPNITQHRRSTGTYDFGWPSVLPSINLTSEFQHINYRRSRTKTQRPQPLRPLGVLHPGVPYTQGVYLNSIQTPGTQPLRSPGTLHVRTF